MDDRAEVAAIRGYIDHLQDKDYVRAVLDRLGTGAILSSVEHLVRSGDRDVVNEALLFIQDAIVFGLAPRPFYAAYRRSELPALLAELIYGPDYVVRHLAVHALNRLGPRGKARVLADAVPWYLVHDPLNVDALLVELSLRDRHIRWRTCIEAMATASSYLTRWAAVELLWERGMCSGWLAQRQKRVWVRQLLRRLADDSNVRVRYEARWRLDQARAGRPRRGLPRWRRRALVERLRQGDPELTYFTVWLNVGNYLSLSGEPDYDLALVEALIQHVRARPITPGYDIEAYWQPLMTARGVQRQ